MAEASIVVQADGFTLYRGTTRWFLRLDDVAAVTIYKRDELTTDLICCDITTQLGDTAFVDENMLGFDEMMCFFERLPGFRCDWRKDVVQPPFAENRTLVFCRDPNYQSR